MTEGTMNKYPSTITEKTIEQIAEELEETPEKIQNLVLQLEREK